ncbi:MAG: iron ABC transporter permease [Gammaproteobacteria bacterium]|nr:iron ABC transporter permease [Gammaproteobacteria bacterium]
MVLSLTSGSINVTLSDLLIMLSSNEESLQHQLVLELRLPRALGAFVTGAMLALAGALMQVLLRNPLADPYVLGVSGGAAVAAMLAILAGLSGLLISGSAFLGAMLAMLLVFGLARGHGSWTPHRLLLTGIVLASGWGAVINFIMATSPDQVLRSMVFWMMGDLGYVQSVGSGYVFLLVGLLVCLPMARSLNILTQGELQAGALGVNVNKVRITIYIVASLLTAGAVTMAGSIGFVGLVVPHLVRLMGVTDHRLLLPASALLGGCLLILADTAARTIIAPQQLPVGVISATLGVPLFLYLLYHGLGRRP